MKAGMNPADNRPPTLTRRRIWDGYFTARGYIFKFMPKGGGYILKGFGNIGGKVRLEKD
jgi:hypothetical protein